MATKVLKILLVMTLVVARWKMVETLLESLKVYIQLVHNDDIHVNKTRDNVYACVIRALTCAYSCVL